MNEKVIQLNSGFTVQVTAGDNTVTYNNNGDGYPVQDNILFQSPQSCIANSSDSNGNYKMTITAAVSTTDVIRLDGMDSNVIYCRSATLLH